MKNQNKKSNTFYAYNIRWANYLVLHGAKVTGCGISKTTGKVFIAFDYESTREGYEQYYANKNAKSHIE